MPRRIPRPLLPQNAVAWSVVRGGGRVRCELLLKREPNGVWIGAVNNLSDASPLGAAPELVVKAKPPEQDLKFAVA